MQTAKKYIFPTMVVIVLGALVFLFYGHKTLAPKNTPEAQNITNKNTSAQTASQKPTPTVAPAAPEYNFVGPRGNVPADAPKDYGFWSFAIPVPGILSRSGQPTIADFTWLKANGWKSDVDLRIDGDHNEVSDDAKIPGFTALGLNYLKIQMLDGAPPTDAQAEQFLAFVTKPENQPAEVHCRGGIGRAGIMVALYRYAVQGWPIDKIMGESKLYQGGIDAGQQNWLNNYAKTHAPGSYGE
ncbi:MAG: hypothetical protein P4L62_02520 [Candidatus Pacebacteria bacterium]|nr:hypothetical protein [Candidatus Paceibacterota bacterium]MDR3583208.1 hypothetical protein [Candidatus Paceibacterota bacterium]